MWEAHCPIRGSYTGSVRISVRLFATYREQLGTAQLAVDLPAGSTAADAVALLAARLPALREGRHLLARNREYVEATAALADGDELALIPPVSGGEDPRVLVTERPLSVDAALALVRDDEAGGYVAFVGAVRRTSRGKRVTHLEYEAYAEMAAATMTALAARLEQRHGARLALHHRVGALAVGDLAVVIAASAPHRAEAFAAARAAIEELKASVPIWKKEFSDDGAVWIEDHP